MPFPPKNEPKAPPPPKVPPAPPAAPPPQQAPLANGPAWLNG